MASRGDNMASPEARKFAALRQELDDITRLVSDMVWSVDKDLRIADFSMRVVQILGYHPAQLRGRKIEELGNIAAPEGGGEFSWFSPFRDVPFEARAKDGEVRHLLLSGLPIFAPDSQKFIGIRGTARDITEAKAASENQRKLSSAVEQSPAMVLIADANGVIEYANPRFGEVTGYQPDETIGQYLTDLNPDYPTLADDEDLRNALENSQIWNGEFQSRKKNGDLYWEIVSFSAVRNEHGQIAHLVAVKEDITRRKHNEIELSLNKEKAEAANQAKSEFLANMSHELRTPLNAVIGFSEAMQDQLFGELGNPIYREYAQAIFNSGHHLLQIINDILDLAKVESGTFELDESEVDLREVIDWCVSQVAKRAEAGNIMISVDFQRGFPMLFADERGQRQIFLNLLSNAVKFTLDGGSIELKARQTKNGDLEVSVIDDGIGIPEDKMDLIMRPFEQADNTMSRKYEGTGLGLPNTKALIELHGGELSLESAVGKGTTVTARFPKKRALKRPAARKRATA